MQSDALSFVLINLFFLAGASFTYIFQAVISYSDFKNFKIKKAINPAILGAVSFFYCLGVIASFVSTSTYVANLGAACGSIFGFGGLIFYFRTMSDYLKVPRLKVDKYFYGALGFIALTGFVPFFELLVWKKSIFLEQASSDMLIFQLSKVMGVPNGVFVFFLSIGLVLSIIKILQLLVYAFVRRSSIWVVFGLLTSILFQINDIVSMSMQFYYALPLAGYMYLIEIIRITHIYHKEAMEKTSILEQQVRSLSSVANMAYVAGSINHDLKNHLTKALLALDFLKRNYQHHYEQEKQFQSWLDKAISSCNRIASLSSNYLKLLRGSPSNEPEVFFVSDAALVVKELTSDAMIKNDIKCVFPSLEKNTSLYANKTLFEQSLINLLNNSIEAIKGTEEAWIEVRWEEKSSMLEIYVTDAGPGISEQMQKCMFERGESGKTSGNGLGLWLSREIIEEMNGSISYLKERKNTCFLIQLPLS